MWSVAGVGGTVADTVFGTAIAIVAAAAVSHSHSEGLSVGSDIFNDIHPVALRVVDELVPTGSVHVVHCSARVLFGCGYPDDLRLGAG